MTISDRIFELLDKSGMSQKEFSEATGIAQSTISDWKHKHTNPIAEKIMIICEVLNVSPEELLSGADPKGKRSRKESYLVIDRSTELGILIDTYQSLDPALRGRVQGYIKALGEL